jgi:hypothetical protein
VREGGGWRRNLSGPKVVGGCQSDAHGAVEASLRVVDECAERDLAKAFATWLPGIRGQLRQHFSAALDLRSDQAHVLDAASL